jgi:hypothetical protein
MGKLELVNDPIGRGEKPTSQRPVLNETLKRPSGDHVGWYWTRRRSDPDDCEIREWTGYSWLEHGLEEHRSPDEFEVLSDELEPPEEYKFTYKNWRGEIAQRHVKVMSIWYGTTQWHPEPQWFMHALDLDKKEIRDFAMRDMKDVSYRG